MSWIIYIITDTTNGKKYVGQTGGTLKARWSAHLRDTRKRYCKALANAILSHGASNFEIHILERCDSRESANVAETRWIADLNTLVPNGYNLDKGGNVKGTSESTRELNRKSGAARWQNTTAEERSAAMKAISASIPTAKRSEMCRTMRLAHLAKLHANTL